MSRKRASEMARLRHEVERLENETSYMREAQMQLEAHRDWYLELYRKMPQPWAAISFKGVIEEMNPSGADLLHSSPQRVRGRPLRTFVALPDRPMFDQHLRN